MINIPLQNNEVVSNNQVFPNNLREKVALDKPVQHATNATNPIKYDYIPSRATSIKTFRELAKEGENLPDLKQLFGNHILEGTTVLLPSERGIGKTMLGLQLAIAIAEGHDKFLGEPVQVHGNTLYLNMELGERVIQKRLSKLMENVKVKEQNPYNAICMTERKSLDQIFPKLEQTIADYKPVVVFIDNLRTAFSDIDIEKNKEITKYLMALNELRDKYKFSLVLIHHTKKGTSYHLTNSDMQSGAGAISDLIDGDLFMRRSQQDSQFRILKRLKSRNCEDQEGATLIRLNPETFWFELVNPFVDEEDHVFDPDSARAELKSLKEKAITLRKEGKTFEEIGKDLGKDKGTISRWFNPKYNN